MKLTKASIARLPAPDPSGAQALHWDDELKGFGVLCSGVTTAKSFVVQRGVNGRKPRVTVCTVAEFEAEGTTLEDVRRRASKYLQDMREGKDPKARGYANVTLQRALDDYLAARPNLAERSREGYRATVEDQFKRWLERPLRELTPDMIEARYREIKAEVAAGQKRRRRRDELPTRNELFVSEPGAATANAALRSLRAVWHFSNGRAPDLPTWPAARLKGQWYRVGRRERHVRGDDLAKFYAVANEKNDAGDYVLGRDMRDLVLLMLFTGLRRGEACALRWDYVDLGAGVIRLPAKATKSKRPLDLPMSDLVRDLLVARRALGVEGEFVFPGRHGSASPHLQEPKGAFARLSKRCGFPVNPHALRSTFITVAAGCSMAPAALKGLVNHAIDSGDVTGGYVQEVELRKAAQAVANALKRRCGIAAPRGKNVAKLRPKRRRRG